VTAAISVLDGSTPDEENSGNQDERSKHKEAHPITGELS